MVARWPLQFTIARSQYVHRRTNVLIGDSKEEFIDGAAARKGHAVAWRSVGVSLYVRIRVGLFARHVSYVHLPAATLSGALATFRPSLHERMEEAGAFLATLDAALWSVVRLPTFKRPLRSMILAKRLHVRRRHVGTS